MLRYVGQVGINKLHVADRVSGKEFLGWTALGLRKMAVEVSPTKVKIGEIALRDPAVQLITGKDGGAEPVTVDAQTGSSGNSDYTRGGPRILSKNAPPPTPIEIDVVRLSKLSATFVDESIDPVVATGITDLSAARSKACRLQVAKADVALSGKVDEVAPLKIQGQINPLSEDTFTHLTFVFKGWI